MDTISVENDAFLKTCLSFLRFLMKYHHYKVVGMDRIPETGPALIVINHSLATYDGFLLGAAIFLETGRYAAGLADRRIFQTPGLSQLFLKLGAVEGSHKAAEEFLQEGKLLMLSPGGMRESLRPSTERYRISWDGRLGFARLAIHAQVPVILAACPAADDIYTVYQNPLTAFVYQKFKWPLPIAHGFGPTAIPRPVKLTHYLSHPIAPPPLHAEQPEEEQVRTYHAKLVHEMEKLLRKHG